MAGMNLSVCVCLEADWSRSRAIARSFTAAPAFCCGGDRRGTGGGAREQTAGQVSVFATF